MRVPFALPCELPFDPRRLPFYLTWLTLVVSLCSITAMNIGLGLAFTCLVVCHFHYGQPFRFPPVKTPLAAFLICTVWSIALSGHVAEGWEGIRKFYLFLVLLLVSSTFSRQDARSLVIGLAASASLSGGLSLVQFVQKYQAAQAAGQDFRLTYTAG